MPVKFTKVKHITLWQVLNSIVSHNHSDIQVLRDTHVYLLKCCELRLKEGRTDTILDIQQYEVVNNFTSNIFPDLLVHVHVRLGFKLIFKCLTKKKSSFIFHCKQIMTLMVVFVVKSGKLRL